MGMLKSINLKNYKCFKDLKVGDADQLSLAPLTILCGVNSCGKSSIINSLLTLKQSYEDNSIGNSMRLNGKYIKCGNFQEVSFKKNKQPVTFSITYELNKRGRFIKGSSSTVSKSDIQSQKILSQLFGFSDDVSFVITSSVTLKQSQASEAVDQNILKEQIINITPIVKGNEYCSCHVHLKRNDPPAKTFRIEIQNLPIKGRDTIKEKVFRDVTCYFSNFYLTNAFIDRKDISGIEISEVLNSLFTIFRANSLQFQNIHYLTPLRVYPQSKYFLDYDPNSVGLSGEYTPAVMSKNWNSTKINGFLPPECESSEENDFSVCIQKWMNYLGFGKYSMQSSEDVAQILINGYNIANSGFGISQVLPILVEGLLQKQGETLLLEQPEIHLHPAAQMQIADFLLAMVQHGKGLIVETHSDHIINRVVRRVLENAELQDIVKIYFIDQDEDGISSVQDIQIDPHEGAICENSKFFYQFAIESEKILNAAYRNLEKDGE